MSSRVALVTGAASGSGGGHRAHRSPAGGYRIGFTHRSGGTAPEETRAAIAEYDPTCWRSRTIWADFDGRGRAGRSDRGGARADRRRRPRRRADRGAAVRRMHARGLSRDDRRQPRLGGRARRGGAPRNAGAALRPADLLRDERLARHPAGAQHGALRCGEGRRRRVRPRARARRSAPRHHGQRHRARRHSRQAATREAARGSRRRIRPVMRGPGKTWPRRSAWSSTTTPGF